jgi:hypothetical protein
MTKWLLIMVAVLTVALIVQATTRSAVAAWASMAALFVVVAIRYEFWPGTSSRRDEDG